MKHTLNDLGKRTQAVIDEVVDAGQILNRSIWTNGFGVLADPSMLRARLLDARTHIEAALMVINSTEWPSDDDCDALERAHNTRDIAHG
jgi:hypothetical protein